MSYPEFSPVRDIMWVEIIKKDEFWSAVGTKYFFELSFRYGTPKYATSPYFYLYFVPNGTFLIENSR